MFSVWSSMYDPVITVYRTYWRLIKSIIMMQFFNSKYKKEVDKYSNCFKTQNRYYVLKKAISEKVWQKCKSAKVFLKKSLQLVIRTGFRPLRPPQLNNCFNLTISLVSSL